MKRLVSAFYPTGSPVKIQKLTCGYKAHKEPTTFMTAGQQEGVHASVQFEVLIGSDAEEQRPDLVDDGGAQKSRRSGVRTLEAVEFTFVLFDLFDRFLASVQGLAGPGKYRSDKKNHKSQWVFELDGVFGQYHALCFPSQARLSNGAIWRCSRDECVLWLNDQMREAGEVVMVEDVFPGGGMREGLPE